MAREHKTIVRERKSIIMEKDFTKKIKRMQNYCYFYVLIERTELPSVFFFN